MSNLISKGPEALPTFLSQHLVAALVGGGLVGLVGRGLLWHLLIILRRGLRHLLVGVGHHVLDLGSGEHS